MSSRYKIREESLSTLGFSSYSDYLESPLWTNIRERVLRRDKECKLCSKPAYTAHHITYSLAVLKGEDDSQLISICQNCHKAIEFDDDKKLTYTSDIAEKLFRRAINKLGGHRSKEIRQLTKPRCRCCLAKKRKLGRNDICLQCYRSGKAIDFLSKN